MGPTYMASLIAGTLTVGLYTKPRCKLQVHEDVDNNNVPARDSERTSSVAVVSAFILSLSICTTVVGWSLMTKRLSKVNRLDWELYWMSFSMNCLWHIAQAAYMVGSAHGRVYSWLACAEAAFGGVFFLSDSFDTLHDVVFAGLSFPFK